MNRLILFVGSGLIFCGATLVACHAPAPVAPESTTVAVSPTEGAGARPTTASPSGAAAGPVEPAANGFNIFAEASLHAASDMTAPASSEWWMHLCSLRGATMLCGLGDVFTLSKRAFVKDPSLEVGLPKDGGSIREMAGHWPDDAWLLWARRGTDSTWNTAIESIYQWRGDHWSVRVPEGPEDKSTSIVSWGGDAVLIAFGGDGSPDLQAFGPHGFQQVKVPPPRSSCKEMTNFDDMERFVHTFADGSFMAPIDYNCNLRNDGVTDLAGWFRSTAVHHWDKNLRYTGFDHLEPDGHGVPGSVRILGLSGDVPTDVVAFGLEYSPLAPASGFLPYLSHFDGHQWTPIEPPSGLASIVQYVRDASGRAWVYARGTEVSEGTTYVDSVWTQKADGSWAKVVFPVPTGGGIYGLWTGDDGAVWIASDSMDDKGGYAFVLESTLTPSYAIAITDEHEEH